MMLQNGYTSEEEKQSNLRPEAGVFIPGMIKGLMPPKFQNLLHEKNRASLIFDYLSNKDLSSFMKTTRVLGNNETVQKYMNNRKEKLIKLKNLLKILVVTEYPEYRKVALKSKLLQLEIEIPTNVISNRFTIGPELWNQNGNILQLNENVEFSERFQMKIRPRNWSNPIDLNILDIYIPEIGLDTLDPLNIETLLKKANLKKIRDQLDDYGDMRMMEYHLRNNFTIKLKLEINAENEEKDTITLFGVKCLLGTGLGRESNVFINDIDRWPEPIKLIQLFTKKPTLKIQNKLVPNVTTKHIMDIIEKLGLKFNFKFSLN
jgi:hypothetical protein